MAAAAFGQTEMLSKITSLLLLSLLLASCAPRAASPSPAVSVTATPVVPASKLPALPSSTPAPIPNLTSFPSATPTPQAISVTAVNGNLFIRRGPSVAYNSISVLYDGQSAPARARDVLSNWLEVPIPGQSENFGWISIQTIYSSVNGDVTTLPEAQPTDWPVPAFLRNCTSHEMTTQPGGIVLPSLENFPANDVRINPGTYRVYDTDVAGSPEVLKVDLREGSQIDVLVNGDGESHKCP